MPSSETSPDAAEPDAATTPAPDTATTSALDTELTRFLGTHAADVALIRARVEAGEPARAARTARTPARVAAGLGLVAVGAAAAEVAGALVDPGVAGQVEPRTSCLARRLDELAGTLRAAGIEPESAAEVAGTR